MFRPHRILSGLLLASMFGILTGMALPELVPTARALEPQDRLVARDAFRAAEAGEWQRAFQIVEPLADPLPAKTLRWLRMSKDQAPGGFAETAHFLMANPHWPLSERLQAQAENRIVDPADHDLVRRFFEDRAPRTTRGHIRYAQALFQAGESKRAEDLIRQAWVEGDFSSSEEASFTRRYGRYLTQEDHIARLQNLLWGSRTVSARRMVERVPERYRRLAEARVRLQRREGGVDRAIEAVPAELRSDPGLVFDRIRWRREQQRHEDAARLLLDPPAELVRPGMWWFEREYQIRRALRLRDFDLAYALASRHGQIEGLEFAEAEWLAGWLALRFAGQPQTALRRFISLYNGVGTPISLARAAYWAGRAAGALKDEVTADTWYRIAARHWTTHYGQLAAAEIGEEIGPNPILPPSDAQRAEFEGKELVRVVRMLIQAEAYDSLSPFLIRLAAEAGNPTEVGLAADLAAESRRPDLVTLVGKYASYNGLINEAAAFPVPDIPSMLQGAAAGPEPALVLSVARQESVFNPVVVSRAGARGLLQLMPQTAAMMARELRLPYNEGLLTGDPDYNVRLGTQYLRKMIGRFGDVSLAAAAYNAGPGRVDEWMRLHGDPRRSDRYAYIDWLELIPFAETRNYVQRVRENHAVYRRLLGGPSQPVVAVRALEGPIDPPPMPALRPQLVATPAAQVAEEDEPAAGPEAEPAARSDLAPAASGEGEGTEVAHLLPTPKLKPSRVALAPVPEGKPSS